MLLETLANAGVGPSKAELEAIEAVVAEQSRRRSGSYTYETARVGRRLGDFLTKNRMSLRAFVAANEGQEIAGTEDDPSPRKELMGVLRGLLEALCAKGFLELAYERCVLPADGMEPHADPRGLKGFAEAVTGIYPMWLVPERFKRAIDYNAEVSAVVRGEFRAFADKHKKKLNEKTLNCYWETIRNLAKSTEIQSLKELEGYAGVAKLQGIIDARNFCTTTSTLIHLKRILGAMFKEQSPFKMKDASGDLAVTVPDAPINPVIKDGASFHKNGKRHKVIKGEVMECRIRSHDLKKLVHFEDPAFKVWREASPSELARLYRVAQEDALVKFWAIIKDRPAELMAHNINDWKLIVAQDEDPDSQMFDGDGYIFNNYRESTKKQRPTKPFPRWLAKMLRELWLLRRAYFATKGDCDNLQSQEIGLLRSGVPLWVDTRTGRRASDGQLLEMLRRGLVRAGLKPDVVEHITGYWFRKGVISTEYSQGKIDAFIEKTGGHTEKTAHDAYITEEMAPLVLHERETYWRFLGINRVALDGGAPGGGGRQALGEVKETARRILEQLKEQVPGVRELSQAQLDAVASTVAFNADGRVKEKEAAKMLGISPSTTRRWVVLGLLEKFREGGRVYYLKAQLKSFLETYSFLTPAAELIGKSTSYLRRLCRDGIIIGAKKIGGKSYLLPWAYVRSRVAEREKGSRLKEDDAKSGKEG